MPKIKLSFFVVFTLFLGTSVVSAVSAQEQGSAPDRGSVCLEEFKQLPLRSIIGASEPGKEIRYGEAVTLAHAKQLDEVSQVRDSTNMDGLRAAAIETLGDSFVSITWDPSNGAEFRVIDPAKHETEIESLAAKFNLSDHFKTIPMAATALSERARVSSLKALATPDILSTLDEGGLVAIESDELCGRVLLYVRESSATDQIESSLAAAGLTDGMDVKVAPPNEFDGEDALGRTDFTTNQSGGLRYNIPNASAGYCTSNVPWYKDTPNGREYWLLTAAHCAPQSTWSSTPNQWNQVWWTTATTDADVYQGGVNIGPGVAYLRYGGELDVAVWPKGGAVGPGSSWTARTLANTNAYSPEFKILTWFQWDPVTGGVGGDAVSDIVCHSGATQAYKAPNSVSGQSITQCAAIADRGFSKAYGSPNQSWFYNLRSTSQADQMVCGGDSGGTVWRDGWLAGVVKAREGNASANLGGQFCNRILIYSHVGYIRSGLGVYAPVTFS